MTLALMLRVEREDTEMSAGDARDRFRQVEMSRTDARDGTDHGPWAADRRR
jgi:hypothetical protein